VKTNKKKPKNKIEGEDPESNREHTVPHTVVIPIKLYSLLGVDFTFDFNNLIYV
jgi:hypothetical protein